MKQSNLSHANCEYSNLNLIGRQLSADGFLEASLGSRTSLLLLMSFQIARATPEECTISSNADIPLANLSFVLVHFECLFRPVFTDIPRTKTIKNNNCSFMFKSELEYTADANMLKWIPFTLNKIRYHTLKALN